MANDARLAPFIFLALDNGGHPLAAADTGIGASVPRTFEI
jgi:hypothetical protein